MLSNLHLKIIDFIVLKYSFLKIEKEYKINRSQLRLDIYLPDLKLGIEIQGIQHYKQNDFFHKNSSSFLESNLRDREKYLLALNNGITILYIKFDDKNPIEKIKKNIDKRILLMEEEDDILYISNRFHHKDKIQFLTCPICKNRLDFKEKYSEKYGEVLSDDCCGRRFMLLESSTDEYMTTTEKI